MPTNLKVAAYDEMIDSPTAEADIAAIRHLHDEWWAANRGCDIPRMVPNFPEGPHYLMFNLQGHPYYGIEEKTKLWEFYSDKLDVREVPETRIVEFVLKGDVAWLAAEIIYTLGEVGGGGVAATSTGYQPTINRHRVRSTECYLRNDGTGRPEWRMWHFHCSPLPTADEPRPGFGDTARERGELVP